MSPAVAALAFAAAVVLFMLAWALLHRGFYRQDVISDLPVYEKYGRWIDAGLLPYRDFRPEYPPLALPTFAVPALAPTESGYRRVFEALMAACGAGVLAFVALTLHGLRAPAARTVAALAFVALAPLALGSVVLSRFDLWPAVLTAAALAAVVAGRDRLGGATLGLAVAAKIYPAVLLPIVLAWAWRRRGGREAATTLGVFAGALIVCFAPFAALAPDGVAASLGRQLSRPLQIESLGSAILLALREPLGYGLEMRSGSGSQNIAGPAGTVVGILATLIQAAALVAVWVRFSRGAMSAERLVRFSAAAVVVFVAFGKVLSPQFLIWLLPLVPLVAGRRGIAACALLLLALVLTQLWFPFRYWDFALRFDETVAWLVLTRDLALVALAAVLVWPLRTHGPRAGVERAPPA